MHPFAYKNFRLIRVNFGGAGGGALSRLTLKGAKYVWPPQFFVKLCLFGIKRVEKIFLEGVFKIAVIYA